MHCSDEELKLEPLYSYTINQTFDDVFVFEIPGYYPGEPSDAVLLYNGNEHAILVRNDQQKILCDKIHPQIRDALYAESKVIIKEKDTGKQYTADVVLRDIDEIALKAYEIHDYRFEYNPYPLTNGTFETGSEKCECCDKEVHIFFRGRKVLSGRDETILCPECILNGKHIGMGADLWPGLDDECMKAENAHLVLPFTPPFIHNGKPSGKWAVHCNKLALYLGNPEGTGDHLFRCCECGEHITLSMKDKTLKEDHKDDWKKR